MGLKRNNWRKCLQFICLTLFFVSSTAWAIGLGDIKLKSSLNEPLKAQIGILKMGSLTITQLKVGLASREEFAQFEVERRSFLSDLHFKLTYDAQKMPIIEVSSHTPMVEPIVTFIVSLGTGNGKILRQYTLFLDPPQYRIQKNTETPALPVPSILQPTKAKTPPMPAISQPLLSSQESLFEPEKVTEERVEASPITNLSSSEITVAKKAKIESNTTKKVYGPTTPSDTLWKIANQVIESNQVTIQQVMLALYEKNPQAFYSDNMNALKSKAVLKIPSMDEIKETSRQQAEIEVSEQMASWRVTMNKQAETVSKSKPSKLPKSVAAKEQNLPPPVNSQPPIANIEPAPSTLSSASMPPPPLTSTAPEVKPISGVNPANPSLEQPTVINPSSGATAAPTPPTTLQTGTGNEILINTLKTELATLTQNLNESKQANLFLQEKINEITQQNKQILNLLAQRDHRIIELEQGLSSVGKLQEVQQASQSIPNNINTEHQLSTTQVKLIKVGSQAGVAPKKAKSIGWFGTLGFVFILLMITAGIYWFLRQRRLGIGYFTPVQNVPDVLMNEYVDNTTQEPLVNAIPSPPANTDLGVQEEVSVYMAYGRYEKAAQVLKNTLEEKGSNPELTVMLLECYLNLGDKAAFERWVNELPANFNEKFPELAQKLRTLMKASNVQEQLETKQDLPPSAVVQPTIDENEENIFSEPLPSASEPSIKSEPFPSEVSEKNIHEISFEHIDPLDLTLPKKEMPNQENENQIDFEIQPVQDEIVEEEDSLFGGADDKGEDTKLDLARAYIEMGEISEAKALIEEVIKLGDPKYLEQAQSLLKKVS